MGLRLAIFLLSAAALAYEVLLTRLLAIVQWHHFAYLVISLALLGYGASGTFLSLGRRVLLRRFEAVFLTGTVGFAVLSFASFALAQRLRFNPLEIVWSSGQLGSLLLLQLVLSVPFFVAAVCIGLTFMRFEDEIPRIYRADLLGAGAGAGIAIVALSRRPPGECLALVSALALLATASSCLDRRLRVHGFVGILFAAGGVLLATWRGGVDLEISEYKGLAMALEVPESRVLVERSGPLGLLTVVASPRVPFRHAPGLSLSFPGQIPEQLGLFVDGDSMSAIDRASGDPGGSEYLDYLSSAVPYALRVRPRVAVLGASGGQVVLARRHDAARIDVIEPNAQLLELLLDRFREFAGDPLGHPSVQVNVADPRGFFAGSEAQFDLIQAAYFDSGSGGYALRENYFYTVESFEALLGGLRENGLLALTHWLQLPPRATLKLIATATEALERSGVERPEECLALMRSWDSVILLVKRGELVPGELEILRRVARQRSFDLAYLPGIEASEVNQFNVLEEPYFYDGALALLGEDRRSFVDGYKFEIEPATDDRPYFHHFFRWKALSELLRLRVQGGSALIEWGYVLLIADVFETALVGFVLVLLPLWLCSRREPDRDGARRGVVPMGVYFLCLGLAFLFLEIAFIQRFVLFLSHPLYAVAVVLAAFLVFAGLGSGMSRRWAARWRAAVVRSRWSRLSPIEGAVLAIGLIGALYLVALPPLLSLGIGWPLAIKMLVTVLLVAPLALFMGMPFPLGLERVATVRGEWIPWAWGLNGWASVLSALLAVLIALHFGFTMVVALALVLYAVAAAALRRLAGETATGIEVGVEG